jgi:uncharacterized protein (DUF1684 family)
MSEADPTAQPGAGRDVTSDDLTSDDVTPDTAAAPEPPEPVAGALAVVDWRRRTHDLYRAVREVADAGDPAAAHRTWREGRDDLFAHHPASPLLPEHRSGFTGLTVAPYDERYRFEVDVEPAPYDSNDAGAGDGDAEPLRFVAATGTDGDVPYERLGRVRLATPDGEVVLDLWRLASYGGGLFLPVRDGTSGRDVGGHESYGGGRYVLDTVKGADLGPGRRPGTLVVDLNFAYHPSCAYDPHWACPLAPQGSTTAVPLPVGEQHRGPWVLAD